MKEKSQQMFWWFLSATLIWFWKHYIPLSLEFPNKWNYADFVRPGPFSIWLYLTHFYIWKSFSDKKQKFPDLSAASRHQTFENETELRKKVRVCVCKIVYVFTTLSSNDIPQEVWGGLLTMKTIQFIWIAAYLSVCLPPYIHIKFSLSSKRKREKTFFFISELTLRIPRIKLKALDLSKCIINLIHKCDFQGWWCT